MPEPIIGIRTATIEEQLLEKINILQKTIEIQLSHVVSDLELLYYFSVLHLLFNFSKILTSEEMVNTKKEGMKKLLAERWHDIKGSSGYSYCEQPRDLLNQLCLEIALYISPLPEDLSECDDWQVGEGPYFLLMPDLEACSDIVLNTNIHQYRLQEFILSEDHKRFIPIAEIINFYFNGSSLKPLHMVFTAEQMADVNLDKKQDLLTDAEFSQLSNHSVLTAKIMENLVILKDPTASFFNRLSQLADGLLAGSAHGGSGTGDNAAAQANEAIVKFFEYWDALIDELKNYYLQKVPSLKGIFQRLKDPVSISLQGINYCVGVTGGDLRYEINRHRSDLQSGDDTNLQHAVQGILTKLERAIKQSDYTVNPVQKQAKPSVSRIINIQANEQGRLIRQYLNLDYSNFLFYAFDQQPSLVPMFIKAFQSSSEKQQLIQQRASNGMSLLMIAAISYPEALDILLASCLELNNTQIKEELMTSTPAGESLPLIIMQRCPEALPQLFAAIAKLEQEDQLKLLVSTDRNNVDILTAAMENNPRAFNQLCELIHTFPAKDIAKILDHTNSQGNTVLMTAFLDYPYAVPSLMVLFSKCKEDSQKNWVNHCNQAGLSLPFLAINTEFNFFKTILDVVASIPNAKLRTILTSSEESFFLRASYSYSENFNATLMLLDKFSPEEQRVFLQQRDAQDNHLLLLTMLHQQKPPVLLFNKLKLLSQSELYDVLSSKNHEGFSSLTLALIQQPQYFIYIVDLLSGLSSDQQSLLWGQVDINGYFLPFLALMYAPEHLPCVLSHMRESTLYAALNQGDFNGNSFLALIASFQPKNLPFLISIIKAMPLEQRFLLLSHCNQQGDNLLSWMLQQDISLLGHLFELMEGFTIDQQLSLVIHRNYQNQHMLTISYTQDIALLDQVLQWIDNLNNGKKEVILTALPLSHWFDLLSLVCVNSSIFERLYASYQSIHKKDKTALGKLLNYCDNNSNLLMLILQNNPTLVSLILRDVKDLSDEKIQRQIILQTNNQGENILSLAEKHTPDYIVANLQSFLKRLDKQSHKKMMLKVAMKMHSGDVLISSEMLENCNALELFQKLNVKDAQDNNLLGQIIMRMPYRLPIIIEKMQHLLSAEQIRLLFTHPNQQGLTCYGLALEQNQAAYLCNQIHVVANRYDSEVRMTMLSAPTGQSLIAFALKQGKAIFNITLNWLNTFNAAQRYELIEQFWRLPSEQFAIAVAQNEVDVCQRLINTTRTMPINHIVTLMHTHIRALMLALSSHNQPLKGLFCQWLLTIPQNDRFEILSKLPTEVIILLFDDEQISLVNTLSLNQQAQLLSLRDDYGDNVLVKAVTNNYSCREKLISRVQLFTPQQQAILFQANDGNISFLHMLAIKSPLLLKRFLFKLSKLSSDTQYMLLRQVDNKGLTLLDHLQNNPELYEHVLSIYDNLSLKKQVLLFLQPTGPQHDYLLINSPLKFKTRLVEKFIRFPQSAKIEILLAMNEIKKDSLQKLLETPDLQLQLLEVIHSFPKPVQGVLLLAREESGDSLISWMINSNQSHLKKIAITLMAGLEKTNLSALFKQKNNNGDNFLQDIAKNLPSMFEQVFSVFMNVDNESKVELLLEKNNHDRNLFSDLVAYNYYDYFEKLCKTIAQLPSDQKVNILSVSGIVPVVPTTLWVSLLYGAPQCKSFVKLLNNKSSFEPMLHLLQSLPPQTQITILTNRINLGKTVIDEIKEPEQTKLRLVLKQAKALVKVKKLLDKMAAKIPNEQVFSLENRLHQQLVNRLEFYQNTYYKSIKHIHDLSDGLINDIEAALPQIKSKLSSTNILTTCLKLAGSVLVIPYGGYNLYKKATTKHHVFFQSDQEKILYDLEDLGSQFKHMKSAY